jgi:tetratricopeptide (TPR) repeat protein
MGLSVLVAVMLPGDLLAVDDQPGAHIDGFLQTYEEAMSSGNPFLLDPYDPGFQVFKPLLSSTWYDSVERSLVALEGVQVTTVKAEEGLYSISFVKVQEDLLVDGTFTRGIAGIRTEVRFHEGKLIVLSHKTFPPKGATAGYRSSDPRTWRDEHSEAERALFGGLEDLRDGDLQGAEEALGKAVALADSGDHPRFLMGPAYFIGMCRFYAAMLKYKRGDFQGAGEDLDVALQVHPDFPAGLNLRAHIHLSEAEYAPALDLWRRSLDLRPEQPVVREVVDLLANATESKNRKFRDLLLSLMHVPPSQAVQLLVPSVKDKPRHPVLVPLLAKAHLGSGDPEKALQVLESSRLVGKKLDATYLAARISLKLQQPERALDLFETVRSLHPGYRDVPVFLVFLYASAGRFQEALAQLDGGPDSTVPPATLAALRGKYFLMAGRFLDAVADLKEATRSRLPSRLRTDVAYFLQRIDKQGR